MSTTPQKRPPARKLQPTPPLPLSTSPISRARREWVAERARNASYPPGDLNLSLARTRGFARNPLPILLDAYERFGPIWNCVVGEDFKAAIAHENRHFIFVVMGKTNILLFKI